jgi:hypothetical protein
LNKVHPLFLLFIRLVPLIIRPMTLLAESFFIILNQSLQIYLMPITMLTLGVMAIPVHKNYYLATKNSDSKKIEYLGQLIPVLLLGLIIGISLGSFVIDFSLIFLSIVFSSILIEKFSDEICRYLEFQKSFFGWFAIQLLRNSWPLIAITLSVFSNLSYLYASLYLSLGSLVIVFFIMIKTFDRSFLINIEVVKKVLSSALYLPLNYIPILFRQIPRLLVASILPQFAHSYQIFSQAGQLFSLIFEVTFNIPYRKAISRHPIMIFRRLRKLFLYILFACFFLSVLSFTFVCLFVSILSLLASINIANILILEVNIFLLPMLLSDAILLSILATLSSYVFWSSSIKKCLVYAGHIAVISSLVTLIFFVIYNMQIFENLLLIPVWISACSFMCVLYSYVIIGNIDRKYEGN